MNNYILIDRKPVRFDGDLIAWIDWMHSHAEDTIVRQEIVGPHYWVSTVFIGFDLCIPRSIIQIGGGNPDDYGPPELFETMVFQAANNEVGRKAIDCARCGTWEEAEANHARIVAGISKAVYA